MDTWLKAKTAGLPRWAWVSMFGGAVVLGLYLRSRSSSDEEEPETEEEEIADGELGAYEGTDTAGGLAAAGLVGPAQGQITPVEAPYIPEGITDVLQGQQQVIAELGSKEPVLVEGPERVETTIENTPVVTGGGPPRRKPHHKKPPKHKPKAKKPPKGKKPPRKRPPKKRRRR